MQSADALPESNGSAARAEAETELRARCKDVLPEASRTKPRWLCANEAGSRSCLSPLESLSAVPPASSGYHHPAGPAVDRRVLAQQATGFPHDLDDGQPVAGFCRAFLSVTGRVPEGARPRAAWAAVGVLYDDIVGGLTTVNLVPRGWAVPCGAPVTVPPGRVLANCEWPAGDGTVAFVTENPSVLGAAAATAPGAHVICMSGTPSRTEVAALRRLGPIRLGLPREG